MKYIIKTDELYHHGIKGQRWGKRNGPPYPLDSGDYSIREKKEALKSARKESKDAKRDADRAYSKASSYSTRHLVSQYIKGTKAQKKSSELWNDYTNKDLASKIANKKVKDIKKEYKDAKNERSTKEVAKILGISDEQAEHVKKYAKIVGISLATTAGLVAAGYLITRNREAISKISKEIIDEGKYAVKFDNVRYGRQRVVNINLSGAGSTYKIADKRLFGSVPVGSTAVSHGFDNITANYLDDAIRNPVVRDNWGSLIKDVRINQVSPAASRRLSCWSTSQAYFMSSLTGRDFASMNFQNLVDFNDFGTLYKTKPQIFNMLGKETSDFVGKFGKNGIKFNEKLGEKLITNVFDNVGKANNLTADGKRTIGFMEAGYRSITCTHQWNFEIFHNDDGSKILSIIDGYAGTKHVVGTKSAKGVVKIVRDSDIGGNFDDFMRELYHYNADSLRFYAPSLDSINTSTLATVILGRK